MTTENALPQPGEILIIHTSARWGGDSLRRVRVERVTPGGQIVLSNGERWKHWTSKGTRDRVGDRGWDQCLRREIPGEWERFEQAVEAARLRSRIVGLRWDDIKAVPLDTLRQIASLLGLEGE